MIALLALALVMQDPVDSTLRWQAALQYGVESSISDRAPWHRAGAQLGVRAGRATIIGEAAAVERFGLRDEAFAGELYLRTSSRVSWYARGQVVPDPGVLPHYDATLEGYGGLRGGWEVSGGGRLMRFAAQDVTIAFAGIGRYWNKWYARGRLLVSFNGGHALGSAIQLRRYQRTVDDYVDVSTSAGTELVTLSPGVVDRRRTGSVTLRVHQRVGAWWGMEAELVFAGDEDTPGRFGLSLGAFARW